MDLTPLPVDKSDLRLSESPALSPKLVDVPESRVRSVHLETKEDSMQEALDPGLATTDFFDDNSSEDETDQGTIGPNAENTYAKETSRHMGITNPSDFVSNGGDTKRQAQPRPPHPSVDVTSFNPNGYINPQQLTYYDRPFPEVSEGIPQNETQYLPDHVRVRHDVADWLSTALDTQGQGAAVTDLSSTKEQILSLHAMSLQALMNTDESPQSHLDDNSGDFTSIFRNGIEDKMKPKKKVSILPPPIAIGLPRPERKEHIPTPYPFAFQKSYTRHSQVSRPGVQKRSILVLSLRRHSERRPRRFMELTIPANFDIPTATKMPASPRTKEHQTKTHFETLDFDDAHFFRELRKAYASLAGPFRFLSARKLYQIQLTHSGSCLTCRHSGQGEPYGSSDFACGNPFPRSPRLLISQGLSDSFSEVNLMKHFQKPNMGNAQYMWVHWAHRITTTPLYLRPTAPMPQTESIVEKADGLPVQSTQHQAASSAGHNETSVDEAHCVAGLDFIEAWSPWRIVSVIALVVMFAVAAALLWIFLGISPDFTPSGIRSAGERVTSGCLVGVFVLLIAFSIVSGWIGVSWLVD